MNITDTNLGFGLEQNVGYASFMGFEDIPQPEEIITQEIQQEIEYESDDWLRVQQMYTQEWWDQDYFGSFPVVDKNLTQAWEVQIVITHDPTV